MLEEILPQSRIGRRVATLAATAWLLLGFYLVFLHEKAPVAPSVAEAAERARDYVQPQIELPPKNAVYDATGDRSRAPDQPLVKAV